MEQYRKTGELEITVYNCSSKCSGFDVGDSDCPGDNWNCCPYRMSDSKKGSLSVVWDPLCAAECCLPAFVFSVYQKNLADYGGVRDCNEECRERLSDFDHIFEQ